MLYVLTWKYYDNSSYGILAAYTDIESAELAMKMAQEIGINNRLFKLVEMEAVMDNVFRPVKKCE